MARLIKRIAVLTLGWLFILFGIVGLVLPVLQGVLFLLIGLALLSTESETARRLDVARSYLYKLISAFGIERGDGG